MARSKVTVKLRPGAVEEVLKGPEVQAELRRMIGRVADAAGPGIATEVSVGPHRARAAAWTDTPEARRSEATERSLTRALPAAKGG